MRFIILLLVQLLDLYVWTVIVTVMISWLTAFGVLNTRNRGVYKICAFLNNVTEPPMKFLRRYIPAVGGLDLTPMILIFGIYLLQRVLYSLL